MYKSNDKLKGFYCLRCGEKFNIDDYFTGCSLCSRESLPISLAPYYAGIPEIKNNEKRLFRYGDFLPYLDFPSLGEGGTPLVKAHRLTEKYNLTSLYIKNEFQNPTGSHKDRMSPFIIARALETNRREIAHARFCRVTRARLVYMIYLYFQLLERTTATSHYCYYCYYCENH